MGTLTLATPVPSAEQSGMEQLRRRGPARKPAFLLASAGLAILPSLAACSGGTDEAPDPSETTAAAPITGTPEPNMVNADAAVDSAVAALPGGQAFAVDYNMERKLWMVGLISGSNQHELLVLPDGSEVVEQHERGRADEHDRVALQRASVPLADALSEAHRVLNGDVENALLLFEDGKPTWSVAIYAEDGTVSTVEIDGVTGEPIG